MIPITQPMPCMPSIITGSFRPESGALPASTSQHDEKCWLDQCRIRVTIKVKILTGYESGRC
jgi:hypothetical protein